jgi:metal-responsive CopG/Arc/MetJ family transcriptional regulator
MTKDNETGGKGYNIYLSNALVQRIDEMAHRQRRSRASMISILLEQALNANGDNVHPRITELVHAYAAGHISYDELVREIGQLMLAQLAGTRTPAPQAA